MGYRDCTAALQEGLWQDAAKLLNVHGSEPTSFFSTTLISTPLRYHLDFYECSTCSHHAARITADDLVDETWVSALKFTEAYQGRRPAVFSAVAFLRSAGPRTTGALADSFRYSDPVHLTSRSIVLGTGALVCVFVVAGLTAWSHRASRINARYFARSVPASVSAASAKVEATTFARNEGLAFYHGWQRPLDRQKAAWYFETAAQRGDAFSANMLGTMYEKAFGVPQNYDKALAWYKLAAQQGSSDAAFNLGRIYENGIGVQNDMKVATYWYTLAAKAGNKEAADRVSHLNLQ
jgi:TPR repeat protein